MGQLGYRRERYYIRDHFGEQAFRQVQTCHVAHVKDTLGLTSRTAPNRMDTAARVKSCPPELWPLVEEAVRYVHADKLNA